MRNHIPLYLAPGNQIARFDPSTQPTRAFAEDAKQDRVFEETVDDMLWMK